MANLSDNLLFWYKKNKRNLPWRRKKDLKNPYFVWLSEIMLQQTTVAAAINYYEKFINKWPSVEKLSEAKLDDVLFLWQGLGYYNRAINLHKCAKIISRDYNGKFPNSTKLLSKLPGIGEYTANAISSIAFNKKTIGIDVNVNRVVSRVFNLNINDKKGIKTSSLKILPQKKCGDFMQAIMDLGSTVCTKKKINCTVCPILKYCNYTKSKNKNHVFRLVKKRNRKKFLYIYLIKCKDKIFFKKRIGSKLLNGLMEIPGSEWYDYKFTSNKAKDMAPVKLNWIKVPGILKYNISNYKLEIRFLRAETKKEIDIKYGRWLKKNRIKFLPISTLMKKVLDHLSLF